MTNAKQIRIALAQSHCGPDPAVNMVRALAAVQRAAEAGAALICLPELFRWPYFCQQQDYERFELAEPVPGPTTDALANWAQKLNVLIVTSLFERRGPGLYHNTAVVIDSNGQLVGQYRKVHVPEDPCYHEKFYFAPGELGFRSFETSAGRIGVVVCWDQWFPESVRLLALAGAQIVLVPTAIGWLAADTEQERADHLDAWLTVQRGHAIANGLFVAVCNRVGREGAIEFWGSSFVADPFGRILATAPRDAEELLLADCDLAEVERTRRSWPLLRDRRPDAYKGLLRQWLGGQSSTGC